MNISRIKIGLIALLCCLAVTSKAQTANATYSARTGFITSYENAVTGACWETGTESYSGYLCANDNLNAGEACAYAQCDNNGNCTYNNAGTALFNNRTNTATVINNRIDAWEDDTSPRNGFSSNGDDCHRTETVGINFRQAVLPSNGAWTQTPTYGSTSDHQWANQYTWKYASGGTTITPTACTAATSAYAAGDIRSWSVSLTAGVTYRFSSCGVAEDTKMRIFGTDGFTNVATFDDNGTACAGTAASGDYTAATTGVHFIELAKFDRSPLTVAGTLSALIIDVTPPTISCPANIAVNAAAGTCAATVTYTAPTGTDNCAGASTTRTAGLASGSSFPVGVTTNTFVVTAANGQTATCSFNVTVTDAQAPVISCPANIAVNNTTGTCGAAVSYTAPTGTDNCPGASTAQIAGSASGATFPVGTTTNTFRVTAANAATTTCSFTVTVTDAELPVISCPANIAVNNTTGTCGAAVSYTAPTGSDNCPGASTAQIAGSASGATFPVGTTTNTFRVTAANAATATCSFTVTVTDAQAPVISCPANIAVNNTTGTCGAAVNYTAPIGTDNCPGATTAQIAGSASGATFPVGTTTNTFRVTAANAATATCSFTVTVTDAQAPAISCPANIVVNVDAGTCTGTATWTAPVGTDNCPGQSTALIAGLAPGSTTFPKGATTETYSVTDAVGLTASCSFTVTVIDNIAPAISCPANIAVNVDAGTCTGTATWTAPVGTDNCPGQSTALIAGLAPGSTTFPIGATTETYRVTDAGGLTASCSFTVTVTDNIAPAISCPANIAVNVDAGTCTGTATWTAPTGSDNCPGQTVALIAGFAPGSTTFPKGVTTETYTVTDVGGLTASCSFTVTVTDNIAPTITCPASITTTTDLNQNYATITLINATATDNCGTATVTNNQVSNQFPLGLTGTTGTTLVTWTATDPDGNTSTCVQTIVVNDPQAPFIICGAPVTVNVIPGTCGADVTFEVPYAEDNSGFVTLTVIDKAGVVSLPIIIPVGPPVAGPPYPHSLMTVNFPSGNSQLIWTATDPSGNQSQCTQDIIVVDNENPTITCNAAVAVNNDLGVCGAAVTYSNSSTDNCAGQTIAQTAGLASGSTFPVGTTTNTFVVTDASGNTATCSFNVVVTDNENPTITCNAAVAVNNDLGVCGAAVTYSNSSTDNCAGQTIAQTAGLVSGSTFPIGTTTNTFVVTDASGNTATCSFNVVVTDNENPTITCNAAVAVNNDLGVCGAAVTYSNSSTDNCAGQTIAQTAGLVSGSTFPVGTTTNTFVVTDASGNTATCSFNVVVTDNENPTITCNAAVAVNNDLGVCGAAVTYSNSSTDNCAGQTIAQTAGLVSGSTFPIGTTTNTFVVTDASGNTATCSFNVVVTDNENPTITCNAAVAVNNDLGVCGAAVTYSNSSTDNCAGQTIAQTAGLVSGSTFPIGTTANTFVVTDASGNTATCSFNVVVTDNENPTITCNAAVAVNNDLGVCGAAVTYSNSSTDNCAGQTIAQTAGLVSGSTFPIGTTTNTFVVTDASGNTATCSFNVVVTDNENPTITCNAAVAVNNDLGVCGAAVTYSNSSTDNCAGQTIAQTVGLASGSTFPIGTTTNTFVVTDASGNTATCSFNVVVTDNENPTITCNAAVAVNNDLGICGAAVSYSNSSTDNCAGQTIAQTVGLASGSTFPIGTTTNTFVVTDASGNTATCSFNVVVTDNENPTITCNAAVAVNNDLGICGAAVSYSNSSTDNCAGQTILQTAGLASGSTFSIGTTTNTFVVTDASGNTATCSFNVVVTDNENPTITCNAAVAVNNDLGVCGAAVSYSNSSTDNCAGQTIAQTVGLASGSTFPIGTTTNTFVVTDASGNTATCSFNVVVTDNENPTITCNAAVAVNNDLGICGAAVSYSNSSTDNCAGQTIAQTVGLASGSTFPIGTTTNTFVVTDASGNTATCSFNVVVTDNENPTITCNAAVAVNNDLGVCGAAVSYSNSSTDNCAGQTIAQTVGLASGSTFPIGTTTNTFVVTDASGNTATCSFNVVVTDNENPTITCNAAVAVNNDLGVCGAAVTYSNSSTDNCAGQTIAQTVGLASGSTFPIGTTTNTFVVTDASGNTATCSFNVVVTDNENPTITCNAAVAVNNDLGVCGAAVSYSNSSTDNCAGQTIAQTVGLASGSTFPIGTTTNTFVVTDASGNTATCSFNVVVTDNENPTITCNGAVAVNNDLGVCGAAVSYSNSSTDNCAGQTIAQTVGLASGSTFPIGTTTNTFVVTDASGNTATCSFNVVVTDNENPTITCAANQTQTADAGVCNALVTVTSPVSGDNCGVATVINNRNNTANASGTYPVGTTTVLWTVNDIHGNSSTCTQTITVTDDEAPVIVTCPLDRFATASSGNCYRQLTIGALSATDNCGIASIVNSFTGTSNATGQYPVGTTEVIWTVTDIHGNISNCETFVLVTDGQAPNAICQNITVSLNNSGFASITPANINNGSTDNCTIILTTLNNNIFTCANVGANTVTLSVIDNSGNLGTCNATVTVLDNIAPIALCQNVTVFLNASGIATVPASQVDNGSSDACGIATRTIDNGSLTCANLGSANPVTLTVTDNNGNVSTCSATITVIDNLPPVALCNNFTVALDVNGQATVTGLDFSGASTDNCTIVTRLVNASSFTCANLGSNNVSVILTDQSGNNSFCFPTLTVIDNTPPTITCPANITVNTDAAQCGALVSFTATATDNCTVSSVSQTGGITSGTQFPVGTSTVQFTAADQSGNSSNCTFTVTVNDIEAPNAICQDVTVQLDAIGNGSTTATAVNNGSSDACGIASLVLSQTAFVCSEVGANIETLTVTDVNGNVSTCTATVTVEDNIAPVATCQDVTVQLDATGNGSTTATAVNNGSSDACGIASIALSQTAFVCSEVGANTETLTVTDVNGNVSTCTATVTVEDNIAPVATCQDVIVQLDATGNGSTTATAVDNGSSDACGIASLVLSQTAFVCSEVGANTETLTVTDVNGNVSTCTATVTVEDNIAPVATCQDVTVQLDATGNGSTTATAVDNASSDACGIASLVLSQTAFVCSEVGANTETLTVTDVNGNVSTCTTTVTVEDNIAPVATCQDVTVQLDATGNGSTTAAAVNNGSTDACGIQALVLSQTAFTCTNVGANTLILSVTDVNGNLSVCSATVTVEDNIAPVATCQDVTVQLDATGNGSITAAAVNNGSSDACGIASIALSQTAFVCSEVGANTETLTVTDVNGNVSTCTTTVTVEDNIAPVATCQDVTVILNAAGAGSTTAAAVNNGSSDACGIASLALSQTAFVCSEVGANTETLTVTDVNGNVSTCTTTVTVQDNVAPVATCQNVTINLDASGNASTTATAVNNGSSDACGIASLVLSQTAFTCANVSVAAPTDLIISEYIEGSSNNKYIEIYNGTAASIALSGYQLSLYSNGSSSPSSSPLSGTIVAGGTAVFRNASAPVIAGAVTNGAISYNGNDAIALRKSGTSGAFVDIIGRIGNDPGTQWLLGGNSTLDRTIRRKSSVTAGITVSPTGTGPGAFTTLATEWDGFAIDVFSGLGSHSITIGTPVTLTVTDINGNVSTCNASVTVRDLIAPVAVCQDVTVQLNSAGNGSTTASAVNNGSSDACGIASLVLSQTAFVCSEVGANTEILTVTDVNGNVSTCTSTITVVDAIAPIASCQNVTVTLNAAGTGSTTATAVNNGSSDACGIASLVLSQTAFTCTNVGANPVTLTVTDVNGNASTCSASVTVVDNTAPIALCQNVIVQLDATGNGSTTAIAVNNGSSDACGIASLVLSQTAFSCASITTTPAPTDLFISEYVEGSSNNKYIEIYNGTAAPIALSGYQLRLYSNGTPTASISPLSGTIAAGGTAVFKDALAPIVAGAVSNGAVNFNGDDAIALTKTTGAFVDIIGRIGNDPGTAWTLSGNTTLDKTLRRKSTVTSGVTVNPSGTGPGAFTTLFSQWDQFNIDETSGLGTHSIASGGANPVVLTVTDVNGNVSTCNAVVTVQDNIAPAALCQNVTVQLNATGTGSTTATAVNNGSSDACGIASITLSQTTFNCSEVGSNTETLTVTDIHGNVSTCTATVTVEDNIAPVATCQDVTVQLDATGNGSTTATAVNNGSSDACGIASIALSQTAFVCSEVGANTETLTVTDVNGNVSTCTATVTVEDNIAPVATCQNVTVQLDATGNGSTTATAVNNGSSDACGIASLVLSQVNFACSEVGANTETLTVTDVNGNVSTCTTTVTVEDNIAPVATCQNVTVQLDATGNGSTTATAVNNGSSDACGIASLVLSQTAFVCSEVGANTETLTVTDVNGNVSTCTTTVTVEDNIAPVATCQDVTVQLDATGNGSTTATAVNNGSSDACGIASLVLSQTSFVCSEVGANIETLTVTDVNGNVSTCTATVTVEDNIAPVATCQDVTVQLDATGNGSTTATAVNNGSSDACGIASLVLSQTAFVCSEVGANTETLTVTDVNGNVSTCTATVTVEDNIAPVATCQDVTVQLDATGNGSTTATAVNNGSSDACGIASIALSQTAFVCSEVGANTETLTVTDVNGNVSTCTTTVTVEDNIAPVATCQDVTVQLDATGNGSTTATAVNNGSSDACGIASIALSQTAFVCSEVGANTETLTVTDVNGNVSTCTTTVTVEDNIAPVATCQDVTVQLDATGNGSTTATAVNNGSSDACGIASLVLSQVNFACSEVGANTETLTVTDVNGNVSTCTTTVTVEDNIAPVATCQDITVQLNVGGNGSTTATAVDNGSSDACGIASLVLSQTAFVCSEVGPNTETLTVTDVNGNVSTCTTIITVEDNVAPVATCQNVTVQLDATGYGSTTPVAVNNGSTDACGLLPQCPPHGPMVSCLSGLELDKSAFDCSNVGANTVTLTVTDQHYNSSVCTAVVTVVDNIAPDAICQNVTVQLDATGNGSTTATAVNNGSSDACGIQSIVLSKTDFVCGEVGSNSVTLTVTDVNGNVSTCTATVTVEDNIAPVALCQDLTIQLDNTGNASTTAIAVNNGSSDACGIASLLLSQTAFNCTEIGANTETLTVTDVNGNVSTCASTITVEDNIDAIAICQDVTVQLDATGNGSTTAAAVNNGSSDACGIASLVLSQTAFVCSEVGANIETLTVTDVNGNVSTCTATVTVEDNIAPVATCQDVTVQLDATGNGSTTATAVNNGSSDACGIAIVALSQTAFVCSEVGANTETLTVTDVNGNVSTCTATVTVEDNIAPVATCQDVTVQLDATGNGSTTATAVDNGSSDACGIASLVLSQTAFVCSEVGANTETLTVTDVNGNVSTCTATVTVEDNIAPVATCQDVTVQLDATGNGSTTATAVDNGSSDACGIASLVLSQTAFVCSEVGANTETLTVTDVNGNVSTCTATVTVEDNIAPVAICQDVTVQLDATGNGSTTATAVNNGSSDACGIASIALSQTAFVCSEVGANTETLTVTDVNGNVSTCTATVTVEDNIAPVATCQNVTVQLDATGNGSTTETAVNNGSSDACGIASLVLSQVNFACSEVGANTETLTVTDVNGNVSTCTATVTVEDNIAPVATCQNVTVQLDATGNGSTTATAVDNGSSDACGIASLVLSQTAFVCSEVGANTETLTVTDVNGNVSTCTTTVTVEDNIAPVATCQDVTVQLDATGNGSTTATAVNNGSSDACGIASLVLSQTAFVCSEVGANTETLTVTDVNGNVSTCTTTVTVEDNIAPVATCQDVTVQLDATGNGSTTATAVNNGSSDACGIASIALSQTAFVCSEVGANTETLTVTDVNGNISTCTTTVTVEDNIAPVATCQNVTVQLDATGNGSTTATAVNYGSSDACGIASLVLSQTAFVCSEVGANTETLTVTDVNGNVSTCTATVTVEDNIAPVATCQDVTVQLDATGNGSTTATAVNNGSSDACGIASLVLSQTAFVCSEVGANTETLTVTDVNGNVSTCTATVTVEDNVAPVAICQNVTVNLSAAGTGSITATQINNGSTDACGIQSLSVTPNTFTCANVGANTVVLTVTDVNGNSSTCSSIVTVKDLVAPIAICQNVTVALNASGSVSVTPAQINNGSSDACGIASLTFTTNASFNCTNTGVNTVVLKVTDVNGNISTCTSIVTVTGGALYKYVILANDKVHLHNSIIHSGGIGIMTAGGEAEIEKFTMVTAPGTFVQALDIDVNTGGVVTTQINSVAVVPLPVFETNPFTSNNDITVNTGQTVTLTDTIYNKIKIKKYGTVIFTQPVVNIRHIESDEFAVIKFTQCTKVRLKEHLHMKRNTLFNPDGLAVTVFAQKHVHVKEGSKITATIYAKDEDIKVEGKSNNRTTMTGLFIADKVEKGEYSDWYANSQCGRCSLNPGLFARISNAIDVNCVGATNGSATVAVTGGTAPYTYLWNNAALQTTATATNLGVGNYTVTVTDALGAVTTANVNLIINTFTILATEEIKLGKFDTVFNGSIGVRNTNGKIDIDNNSGVIESNSIAIAPIININSGSTVNEAVFGVAGAPTIAYEGNITYNSNSDLTVANNATFTMSATDTLRRRITIGDNATLIVTAGRLNITDKLELKKNSKIRFTSCTKVRIKGNLITDDNPTINQDGVGVTFYVNGSTVDIDKSAKVKATIFAPNATIKVQSASSTAPNVMTGKFIGKKVDGGDNTKWYENTDCPCTPGSGPIAIDIIKPTISCPANITVTVTAVNNDDDDDDNYGNHHDDDDDNFTKNTTTSGDRITENSNANHDDDDDDNYSCPSATGVVLGTPITSDNIGVATVSNNRPSSFPLGITIVKWTVTDAAGNFATCDQTVRVLCSGSGGHDDDDDDGGHHDDDDDGHHVTAPNPVPSNTSLTPSTPNGSIDLANRVSSIQVNAYPNPFRDEATISFTLPEFSNNARLTIFNLAGEDIRLLYDGPAESNVEYKFKVNADNTMPSGLYFYRLQTKEGKTVVNKLILTK